MNNHSEQPDINIFMQRPHLKDISVPTLPKSYTFEQLTDSQQASALGQLLSTTFDEPWDEVRANKDLLKAPDVHAVFVVKYQGAIVATASSQLRVHRSATSGYVHWVATHPDHRGQRLAYTLVARVLQDFAERGYQDAYLETQPFRLPAIKTYLKLGFIPVYNVDGINHQAIWSAVFQNLLKSST